MQFTPYQAKKELSHTEVARRRTTANASRTSFNNAQMPKVADESQSLWINNAEVKHDPMRMTASANPA
jgi:hypothetical protein